MPKPRLQTRVVQWNTMVCVDYKCLFIEANKCWSKCKINKASVKTSADARRHCGLNLEESEFRFNGAWSKVNQSWPIKFELSLISGFVGKCPETIELIRSWTQSDQRFVWKCMEIAGSGRGQETLGLQENVTKS